MTRLKKKRSSDAIFKFNIFWIRKYAKVDAETLALLKILEPEKISHNLGLPGITSLLHDIDALPLYFTYLQNCYRAYLIQKNKKERKHETALF